MARRFLDDIRADIATLLADNTTGDISPADLRLVMLDIISSTIQDECLIVSTAPTLGISLTDSFSVLNVFQDSVGGDLEFLKPNVNNGSIVLSATPGWSYNIRAAVSLTANQNELVEFCILRDGVPALHRPDVNGAGGSRANSVVIFGSTLSNTANEVIQIGARAVDGSGDIDVQDAILEVTIMPTNNS